MAVTTPEAMDVVFYQLDRQPVERALPALLEKTLQRGWKAVVEVTSAERLAALDDALWTYEDRSFLPHGLDGEPDSATQPVLITTGASNSNAADVRFLTDGARLDATARDYRRIAVLFDGHDPDALDAAREDWKKARAAGLPASYWLQDGDGKWEKKA